MTARTRWSLLATGLALVALLLGGRTLLRVLFYPPAVQAAELHSPKPDGPRFDHSRLDRVLAARVGAGGLVDYAGLARNSGDLDAYVKSLAKADVGSLGRDEKLALYMNAYNAFTLQLIAENWPLRSIKDIPEAKRWDHVRWKLGGKTVSLNQLEHEIIRKEFVEPRIHFAVNCASLGCPPLRPEAYHAATLEQQLETQMREVHAQDRWFRYDTRNNTVHLSAVYDWFRGDFEKVADSPVDYAGRYSDRLGRALKLGRQPQVKFLDWDWAINSQ
ncbi:MAG: DUF547 domain-containing protein [Acidobacteriota bacterium]